MLPEAAPWKENQLPDAVPNHANTQWNLAASKLAGHMVGCTNVNRTQLAGADLFFLRRLDPVRRPILVLFVRGPPPILE